MILLVIVFILLILLFSTTVRGETKPMEILEWSTSRPSNLRSLLAKYANQENITIDKLASIIYIESRGNPNAVNPNDPSFGVGQITLPTATSLAGRTITEDELFNPDTNLALTAKFLGILQEKYSLRFSFAEWAQAYNLGETKFDRGTRNSTYGAKILTRTKVGDAGREFRNPAEIAAIMRKGLQL